MKAESAIDNFTFDLFNISLIYKIEDEKCESYFAQNSRILNFDIKLKTELILAAEIYILCSIILRPLEARRFADTVGGIRRLFHYISNEEW